MLLVAHASIRLGKFYIQIIICIFPLARHRSFTFFFSYQVRMSVCVRCEKEIKKRSALVSCADDACKNSFHKGCLRVHAALAKAKVCCAETSNAISGITVEQEVNMPHSPIIAGSTVLSAADFPQIIVPTPPPPPTLPADFAKMAMDDKLNALMLKAVANEQISLGMRDSVNSVLPIIDQHTAVLIDHSKRLKQLETRPQGAGQIPTSDLVVDNIPLSLRLAFSPEIIAQKLLEVLKIPIIKNDVLESREFLKKTTANKYSIIITFKSNYVRDFVIKTKRKFGKLDQATLLGPQTGTDQIFVSEFLNTPTYVLLTEAKKWKSDTSWSGFIWVQNSQVLARPGTDRSVKPVLISCIDDLKNLT